MKTIGMVGGIGPESTIAYYRMFIASGHSAVLINSVDVQHLLGAMLRQDLPFVADYLVDAVAVLEDAGASLAGRGESQHGPRGSEKRATEARRHGDSLWFSLCLRVLCGHFMARSPWIGFRHGLLGLIAANTPHVVFNEVQRRSALPLVSIVQATCNHVRTGGLTRVALLGTRFTMEGRFYSAVFDAAGIRLVTPAPDDLSYVHDIYLNELLKNQFLPETRLRLLQVIDRLIDDQGVEAVILGGTELPLVLTDSSYRGVPLLDTTRIHVDAALRQVR